MPEPELTIEEQENILLVAQGLLREPSSWVKRKWKCELNARDPKDRRRLLRDENGNFVPAMDDNNQPLYQYCIHGAVNAAALTVLSPERLREFQIRDEGEGRIKFSDGRSQTLVGALGLDEISQGLYSMDAMQFNDMRGSKKEQVVEILRSGLDRLRKKKSRSRLGT